MKVIKITKEGNSNIITATMDFALSAYPTSDGWSHELVENLLIEAREWRDKELEETDRMAQVPDWPNRDKYLAYRTKLRDWPSTEDFPNTRPVME